MPSSVEVRSEQTRAGIDRLHLDVATWARDRIAKDVNGQYRTQLASTHDTFVRALDRIRVLSADLAARPAGEAFEGCRGVDRQISLVRRLWRWYAEKFDQRDDPRYARLLAAADEVVWAVHAEVYRGAGFDPLPPAPLPYLDAVETPEAVLRDDPPARLRPDSFDDHLKVLLSRLPVPVVALPDAARAEPWTLVLLGHEVGHHLQYDLQPRFALVASVGAAVSTAAGPAARGSRWRSWSRELFADVAGLVTMGPSSLAALLPYEFGSDRWLISDERDSYPPPAIRIAVAKAAAERLGLDCRRELADWDPAGWAGARAGDPYAAERAATRADLAAVPAVAAALVDAVAAGGSTLADLVGFDATEFGPAGRVAARVQHLLGDGGPAEQGLATVRELASAAMVAWHRVSSTDDEDRQRAASTLAATLVDRLIDSREPGTRAAVGEARQDTDDELVAMLSGEVRS